SDDAVEFVVGHRVPGKMPLEEDGVFVTNRERGTVERVVAPQEMRVEPFEVLLGSGKEERFIVQGALGEGQPDRRRLTVLPTKSDIPAAQRSFGAVDGEQHRVVVE